MLGDILRPKKLNNLTPSEKYVSELCEKSFLPFWSFSNPIGKKGKELCDILIVCDNTVIIISVKDIQVSENKDESIKYERWVKKAINDSVVQIYGAERFLETAEEVILKNRKVKIKLPPKESRIIYRIAIAFGSQSNFPLPTGDFGKGFVNVFDEKSTFTVLKELDTITDFINYLKAKEEFIKDQTILIPTESDFLALYIQTEFDFDIPKNGVISGSGLWDEYIKSDDYKKWSENIPISYIWDFMITYLHNFHITAETTDEKRHKLEESIRKINLETRMNRIELGRILDHTIKNKVKARMLRPMKNEEHCYVFMPLTDDNWKEKEGELELRCTVARYENPTAKTVIGISIGSNSKGESCFDICSIYIPEIDEDLIKDVKEIQKELGYFKKIKISNSKDFLK
jgi:hypothetical protein